MKSENIDLIKLFRITIKIFKSSMKGLLNKIKPTTNYKPKTAIKLGKVSPQFHLPPDSPIEFPPYAFTGIDRPAGEEVSIFKLESKDLEHMRTSCKLAAELLEFASNLVKPGITTNEIDEKLFDYSVNTLRVYPSPLNFSGFPKSLCTSVNEVLCHGIPDDRALQEGDIVNLDVSAYKNGFHGDTSRTVRVGKVDEVANRLCTVTRLALDECIKNSGPGVELLEIARICDRIAEYNGFNVDPTFCGHGIGRTFHMRPLIRHSMKAYVEYFGGEKNIPSQKMSEGLVFTIEPILVAGDVGRQTMEDSWTELSTSGSISAQYEDTILITKHGAEILTKL